MRLSSVPSPPAPVRPPIVWLDLHMMEDPRFLEDEQNKTLHIHTYVHTYVCMCMYVCTHTYTYTYRQYIHTYVCECIYVLHGVSTYITGKKFRINDG